LSELVTFATEPTGNLLDRLTDYLAYDLERVDAHIAAILDSETGLVVEVGEYVRSTQGKRLRPMLAILASRAFGYPGEDHTKVAASLELVHTATLLHDDVIDKAPLRRACPRSTPSGATMWPSSSPTTCTPMPSTSP
jgi:geranylgeranyl pyrophosphate synthase